MRMNSYCWFVEAENGRVILGSEQDLNWETLGLIHLRVFMIEVFLSDNLIWRLDI